ncbi:GNAT family N-acetyltransferase [Brachybacterium vulturis]|uniref:GNAT family N-acetyltransferase n=1 Tax=Brachybacterium vulturis TaxID=2017484 RepID=UPI001C46F897|nr:GNAT family N-acetyltransferase [Brachybacterium vulturis]
MTSSPAPRSSAPLSFPLCGGRVLLRPFETTDVPAAHAVYGDEEVMRYVGEGGAVPPEETARMIAGYRRHQREHGFACWAVVDRSSGELVGDAGLEVTERGIELGYTLARVAWGRGLATEAARRCVGAAFGPLELPRLVALVDVENPASARVLEKIGFIRLGRDVAFGRPHHAFELTPDHFATSRTDPSATS